MSDQKRLVLSLGGGGDNLHFATASFAWSMNKDGLGLLTASKRLPKLKPIADSVMQRLSHQKR